jgi:chemosensory pili system protein ChpA (sensor histidine kinase/response regulator)
MSQNDELDIGPLTWVKNEIDSALNTARDKLGEVLSDPEQREPLRFAQNHIHQAAGALSIVGLDGVSQFAEAIDKLLSAVSTTGEASDITHLALAQRAIGVLGNYINEIAAGAPHQPLRLYPLYRELVTARNADAPQPSELFFPDLSIRLELGASAALVTPERASHEARALRAHFEKGLLAWLRKPQEVAGPQEMLRAVRRIEQLQQVPATRSFWWSAIAFFEGLATQAIPADRLSQRLCRRIDAQMRRLLEGSQVVAERLIRDVLYFVAANQISTPHAQSVRHAYKLDRMLPDATAELSDTYRQPLVLRVRESLEQCKEFWNRFSAGAAVALPQFQEQLLELTARTGKLRIELASRLLQSLGELVAWLRADPMRQSEDLSMEVATALLVVEQAAESPNVDADLLRHQVSLLCTQFDARMRGESPGTLDDQPFGEAARHAQERLFFNQLAREILTNLGHIEQGLDSYFRNPNLRDNLASLANPLKQIEGAFAVLGDNQALELVANNAKLIADFVTREQAPSQDEFDAVAHELSALGFYVEALKSGPARLEDILHPNRAKAKQEVIDVPQQTVEAQLQRETQEAQQLVEALKETPQSTELRQQLVSNLEAIRDDAQLVADSGLEQKAKEALAGLKSGEATQAQLAETLATVSSVSAPAPSAEAARLMSVSNEELDAELLAIFLEEAHEVLGTIADNAVQVSAERHDFDSLTTIRRGYHTLKGSSRMVGLQDFSEAARHVEMAMNRWLQLEKDANETLLSLIHDSHALFTEWVAQLESGGSLWRDATAVVAQAESLLAELGLPSDELPVSTFAPTAVVAAAAPVARETALDATQFDFDPFAAEADSEQEAVEAGMEATRLFAPQPDMGGGFAPASPTETAGPELDLTSTLLGSDLFAIPSGEQNDYEVDLAATDFDGDALRLFTASADEQREGLEEQELRSMESPLTVDFELNEFEIDDDAIPEPEPVLGAVAEADIQIEEDEEELTELDLTSTFISGELEALVNASNDDDQDLTVTDLELNLNESISEPALVTFDDELLVTVPDTADVLETSPANVEAPTTLSPQPESELVPSAEDLEITVALEEVPLDTLEATPATIGQTSDSEVQIGDQSLSRGLYDLYVGEARQHLDQLVAEIRHLELSPLRVPSVEALRAAHTLAGISGTARIDPAYSLGKAVEHALHRFTDISLPPEPQQTAIFGAAVAKLNEMLADVLGMIMPEPASHLITQLEQLHPDLLTPEERVSALVAPEPDLPGIELVEPLASIPERQVEPDEVLSEAPVAEPLFEEVPADNQALGAVLTDARLSDTGGESFEAAAVHDELDDQLLPIFFEEADELGAALGTELRELRANVADESHLQSVARLLHTLKGSARMTGAMQLGAYVHGLESRLQEHAGGSVDIRLVDELESGLDQIGTLVELLRHPDTATDQANAEGSQQASATAHDGTAPEFSSAGSGLTPAGSVIDELEVAQGQRAPLRVRADLIDRFVNEAGEVSIARTRIEGELRTLRRSMLDLTENVIRLRNQLREVEIQAESQMQSRIAAAESQHSDFDPLEFDRFTRLQELTRMMAESVGDVTTIQQNLLRNLDAADAALHAQGRLSRDLQQALMSVRMVPFEELADRLYRIVRQTSKEVGKRVNLDIQGGSIEIDRGVLDRMTAPIEHLLRNAIAHGVEIPEQRLAAGKPEFGQITLKLNQLSNEIALELSDDGHGLDFERILARGRKSGLIGEAERPTENRLTQLIFEPGFSTAESISGVAGRGVGMDVVKNETLSVGGRIDVSSVNGQGTKFIVHLPLTLAVTQALLVRSGERTYAIPSNMVEQALEVKEQPLEEARSRGYVEWNNTQYPFAYLPRLLGDTQSRPASSRFHWLLLTRAGSQTLAVHIDELRGNQEIVVKNAGPQFVRLQGFSGATVLPDGEISLILNPVALAARHVVTTSRNDLTDEQGGGMAAEPVEETRIPTIMVVDDSLTVRKITSRLLEREGFQVVTAKDGVDALEQLVDMKPDVMLLDIEMPRMDGFDLARNVRADARLRDIPIIMITSRMADKHRNYAMEIGVNHYLGKPYQEEQLLELIAGFIARKL